MLRKSDQHEIPNREEQLDVIEVYEWVTHDLQKLKTQHKIFIWKKLKIKPKRKLQNKNWLFLNILDIGLLKTLLRGEQDWANQRSYKPLKKGAHYQQSFLLEDLYYVHTMDVDPILVRKDNSLYYQCVLYFRSEVVRKVEMWFKKDDREKRTEWVTQITRVRNEIAELKAKVSYAKIKKQKIFKTKNRF